MVATAQFLYHREYGSYAKTIEELSKGQNPILENSNVVNASYFNKNSSTYSAKNGYFFRLFLSENGEAFSLIAYPSIHNESGRYTYFCDANGDIKISDEKELHLRLNSIKDLGQVDWTDY